MADAKVERLPEKMRTESVQVSPEKKDKKGKIVKKEVRKDVQVPVEPDAPARYAVKFLKEIKDADGNPVTIVESERTEYRSTVEQQRDSAKDMLDTYETILGRMDDEDAKAKKKGKGK